ncbi:MAG: hypothetical protein ACT4OO_11205 [Nitrospiraceae bacterium]
MAAFSTDNLFRKISSFGSCLKHAFAVSTASDQPFSIEDLALLERVADAIVNRNMAAPATVFLESLGPMNFLGSQALHFLTPILDLACKNAEVERVAHLLERRDTISRLIALIEAKASSKGAPAR